MRNVLLLIIIGVLSGCSTINSSVNMILRPSRPNQYSGIYEKSKGEWVIVGSKVQANVEYVPAETPLVLSSVLSTENNIKLCLELLYTYHPGNKIMISIPTNKNNIVQSIITNSLVFSSIEIQNNNRDQIEFYFIKGE